jgi:hypothetical protein
MPLPGRPNPTDPGDAADLSTPQGYWYCNRIRRFVRVPLSLPRGQSRH